MINKLDVIEKTLETVWEGKKLIFKSGKLSPGCDGAVVISLGDTSLLVTCVMNKSPNLDSDFLPLAVDFRETFYAGGKIGGAAYTRREGRPSDGAVLTSRLIDRPLRPMFPKGMVNDVILTITALSADRENNGGIPGIIGSSLAIMLAGIPFDGPVGAVRIGYKDGEFLVNPTYNEVDEGELNIVLAGTKDSISMIECGAKQVSTEILTKAIQLGKDEISKVCQLQEQFLSQFQIQPKEVTYNKPSEELIDFIKSVIPQEHLAKIYPASKAEYNMIYEQAEKMVFDAAQSQLEDSENTDFTSSKIKMGVFKVFKDFIRKNIFESNKRVDGRSLDQVRPLYCEVDLIKRVHGSGLFQRGETQVMSVTTLGAPGDVLLLDTMEHDAVEKRFMHHYNMLPFSSNEARMYRGVGRRELGHGALAEKAVRYVLPTEEEFPYTIRCVSEVLNSNGSTSMASVCATVLSLMDAGVPISAPVSGIAMGLVSDGDDYRVLTDIQGLEDFVGDMDFKVAGTIKGITALQMDIKVKGLSLQILNEAIQKANVGRLDILNFMLQTLEKPRENLSPFAPKIVTFKLAQQQVREVIGPGGAIINDIIKQTGVKIDFKDDGTTIITSKDTKSSDEAIRLINEIIWTPSVNDIIDGTITRIESYGVFVSLGKNKTGLAHVKNLGPGYIADPKTVYKEGDKIRVKIVSIDDKGINLKKEI